MTDLRGCTVALMPGTGSDDDFILRAFAPAIGSAGANLVAVRPEPEDLIAGYLRVLDRAAESGPIVVGGVSIGAAVGVWWALRNPERAVAVLAAMPGWSGAPHEAPASISAWATARLLRADGLEAVTAAMRAGSPGWLGDELARSWAVQWPGLPAAMETVAAFTSPDEPDLRRLTTPLAVAAATDDPVHPLRVARDWVHWAPRSALRTFHLDDIGVDPSCVGDACVSALQSI